MKLRHVDPRKIVVPDVRVTSVLDDDMQRMLSESMAGMGQIAPIICLETAEGLTLVDGWHRLVEALDNKWETIDVAVAEGDMVDVLTRNLFLDHIRGKHTPGQMLKVIETLTKEYGMNSEQIAAKTGLKRDYIEDFQLILQLTPMCQAWLDEEKIKLGHAKALTRLKDPVLQETYLFMIPQYQLSCAALNDIISDRLSMMQPTTPPGVATPPPPPPKIRCAYCGDEVELAKIANPSTCIQCSAVLAQSIALARAELAREEKASLEPPSAK